GALRRHRSEPIYICETDARKLKRIRWLLALSRTSPDRCVFMNEELLAAESRGQPLEHWVDRLLSLGQRTPPALSQTDFQVPAGGARAPRLDVSAEDRARTEEWLRAKGWYGRPLVLIQPGNRRTMRGKKLKRSAADDKAWPIETWAALHSYGFAECCDRARRGTEGGAAPWLDRGGGRPAFGGDSHIAAGRSICPLRDCAQHDFRGLRTCSRGCRSGPATGGSVWCPFTTRMAAAQCRLARRWNRWTARLPPPRSDIRRNRVRGLAHPLRSSGGTRFQGGQADLT